MDSTYKDGESEDSPAVEGLMGKRYITTFLSFAEMRTADRQTVTLARMKFSWRAANGTTSIRRQSDVVM